MTKGLRIKSVTRGSQADGKLDPGDLVIFCNGISVASLSELTEAMEMTPTGEDISIEIERQGQRLAYSFLKARLGVAFDEEVGRQDSSSGNPTIAPAIRETRNEPGRTSGDASQSGGHQAKDHVKKGQSGSVPGYDLARTFAQIVIVVGWLSIGIGALAFLIGLGTDEVYRVFMIAAGLMAIWQGILVVLVAYGLVGVFDTADNSAKISVTVQEIAKKLLADKESR